MDCRNFEHRGSCTSASGSQQSFAKNSINVRFVVPIQPIAMIILKSRILDKFDRTSTAGMELLRASRRSHLFDEIENRLLDRVLVGEFAIFSSISVWI